MFKILLNAYSVRVCGISVISMGEIFLVELPVDRYRHDEHMLPYMQDHP